MTSREHKETMQEMKDRAMNIASAAPQFNKRRNHWMDQRDELTDSFMSTGMNNSILKSNFL
jgi:hypothetical protein